MLTKLLSLKRLPVRRAGSLPGSCLDICLESTAAHAGLCRGGGCHQPCTGLCQVIPLLVQEAAAHHPSMWLLGGLRGKAATEKAAD